MKRLKQLLVVLVLSLAFVAVPIVAMPSSVNAHHCLGHTDGSEDASGDIAQCLDAGACLDTEGQGGNCPDSDALSLRVDNIVSLVVNIFTWVVGIVAVIMVIIGGFKYVTSGGDSANVQSAKNTILYAIIGLVVVALAQIIVRFVLDKV